ncbi:hypothetical protein BJX99DRAFT_256345 [Aspergillus californicus]
MRAYLLIALLGAMALAMPVPTETGVVVRAVKVAREVNELSTRDEPDEDGVVVADGF